jgi:hypothetical protein
VNETHADLRSLLAEFPGPSAELVQERELLQRVDTKLLLPRSQLPALLERLRENYAVLNADLSCLARYRSVYLDASDLSLLHDHLRGRRPRHKVRFRHYLDRRLTFLEVKSKDNHGRTTKQRRAHPFGDSRLTTEEQAWAMRLVGERRGRLVPQAIAECLRICLLGIEKAERLTVDLDVTLRNARASRCMRDVALIEVKQPRVDRGSPAFRALRALHARELRVSKYVCAMQGGGISGRPDARLHLETANHESLIPQELFA